MEPRQPADTWEEGGEWQGEAVLRHRQQGLSPTAIWETETLSTTVTTCTNTFNTQPNCVTARANCALTVQCWEMQLYRNTFEMQMQVKYIYIWSWSKQYMSYSWLYINLKEIGMTSWKLSQINQELSQTKHAQSSYHDPINPWCADSHESVACVNSNTNKTWFTKTTDNHIVTFVPKPLCKTLTRLVSNM